MPHLLTLFRAIAVISILTALTIYMNLWDVGDHVAILAGREEPIMQGLVIAAVFLFIGAAYIEEKVLKKDKQG